MADKITAKAFPTKRFFVDMLTRDIDLQDAILDLLDNCVDGILRSNKAVIEKINPYEGFWAKIIVNEKKFQIGDNCGGIPLELARKYAFMMGRPKDEDDNDIPTVGMYGIGMKRAIFKMGRSCVVTSQTDDDTFKVEISKKWLEDDNLWELPIEKINKCMQENGTVIDVTDLRDGVSNIFQTDGSSNFLTELISVIGQHYSFIINKGFKVFVNSQEVAVKKLSLLMSDITTASSNRITPYIYKAELDGGLSVTLAVGFYMPMKSPDEVDEEQLTRRSREDAGWTIICNDRVVVHNDKTRLTGWGEAGVPQYHSQFIGISGVVFFVCNDAWRLPITTTKRGIDTSSETYLYIKDFMREGLKKFTNYTNYWKDDPETEKEISSQAKSVSLESILTLPVDKSWTKVKNRNNEIKLNLELAYPETSNPNKQIRFTKPLKDIKTVSEFFFGDVEVTTSEVGEACFDKVLEETKK